MPLIGGESSSELASLKATFDREGNLVADVLVDDPFPAREHHWGGARRGSLP